MLAALEHLEQSIVPPYQKAPDTNGSRCRGFAKWGHYLGPWEGA